MKSKKLIRYIAIIVVLAIVILLVGKKQGWFGSEFRVKVAVEKGENRDIIEIITANGKIQPETEVKISPDVSGEIVELKIKEGDVVQKGDFLLKIKPDNYISFKNRAEATLNGTKARLTQAEAQLEQASLEF
ncbi:MAG: biotin/lipoyl-binding protein, partial [Bacteroidales bacterium]